MPSSTPYRVLSPALNLTILLAEQNVSFSLDLADRIYVLEKGQIRYQGTAREFREDESIRHQYLAL